MYAAIPETVRQRLQRKHGQRRRGKTPLDVLRIQAARRRLQAYQFGAYDNAESAVQYETGARAYDAMQHENFSDDDLAAGGLGLKIKLKLPKFIRKMKPLKVLGKVAPVAAMVIPGLNVASAAAIGAGGALLRKGKKAKFFKDVLGGAAIAGGGRVALKAAVKGVKKLTPKALALLKRKGVQTVAQAAGLLPPNVALPTQDELNAAGAASAAQMGPVEQAAYQAISPTYLPTETAAAYTPPGEEVPGMTEPAAAAPADMKKLLVPALIAAALLL